MSECDLSGIWFTGEYERNISGAFALAGAHAHKPLRFAHMLLNVHY